MVKDLNGVCQKLRAWILWEAGHRTPKSLFRRGKIPIRSGERYIAEFKADGNWERKLYRQRIKPKQNATIVRKVITKARNRKKIYSLKKIGRSAGVSPKTAQRILRLKGFSYSTYKKKIYLNERRRIKRIEFAESMLEEDDSIWNKLLFTDECSIWLNRSRPSRLWTENAMEEEGTDSHGPKVHLWGGITKRGALKLEIFEENLVAEDYVKILKKKKIEMDHLYPEGWIFQHDGSGVHRAEIVQNYVDTFEEEPLIWPAYSPDLSPIENIWGWLKNQVNNEMPSDVMSLKRCIRKHWNTIDPTFLGPYFSTMNKRMSMVIENDGGKIKY